MWTLIGWILFGSGAAVMVGKIVGYVVTHNPAFLH